jgi:hypothetical protein
MNGYRSTLELSAPAKFAQLRARDRVQSTGIALSGTSAPLALLVGAAGATIYSKGAH